MIPSITPLLNSDLQIVEQPTLTRGLNLPEGANRVRGRVDGLAAILFNEEYPEEELMAQVKECMELFAPKLILGISDELSSTGEIERVRRIREYVDEYNRKIMIDGRPC